MIYELEEYAPKIGKDPKSINIETIGSCTREKVNELLISPHEFSTCNETEDMYIIYPDRKLYLDLSPTKIQTNGSNVILDKNFHYNTDNAPILPKQELRKLLLELDLI